MSFTVGEIVAIFPDKIWIETYYGRKVIYKDCLLEEIDSMWFGMRVVIHDDGTAESATSSFNRWRDLERKIYEETTIVLRYNE